MWAQPHTAVFPTVMTAASKVAQATFPQTHTHTQALIQPLKQLPSHPTNKKMHLLMSSKHPLLSQAAGPTAHSHGTPAGTDTQLVTLSALPQGK